MDKQQLNEILNNVPGSFKAKLERIRRYLHLGKASVMVGAGFSRNADVPSHIRVKQWNDVGEDIYCRLMAVDKVDLTKLEFKTPMRLASQFAATYGRSELDNLIRESIPDDRMNPSELHRQLLSLPWRDIFTTNYDTLLERSRKGLQRTYSVVTSKEMLLYKKSPRIIKLHGSFPDKTPFLMTEEDFRAYPAEHPELVNTVRQALVESIFCLIGFSGDDPNFTSWQGWLRDVMGDYAGPSYLITCDKEYDESFKTLMEHRGIQVLNFSEIKELDDYQRALDFFFTYLSEREPDWNGRATYDSRKIDAPELVEQLKRIRQSYPGWFILPKKYLGGFDDMNYQFPFVETAFKELEPKDKESLLYELDWRADISLTFKDIEWYRNSLENVIKEYGDEPLSYEAITLGISLLRLYRHHLEKQSETDSLKERLRKEKGRMTQTQQSLFYYTVACNALAVLDYEAVVATLQEWELSHADYAGVIFKALVLAETSDISEATELLNDALERITQSLTQTTTEEELSLRCVIENLLAFYSGERMPNRDSRFSFADLSEYIQHQAAETSKKPFVKSHGFGVGASNRTWNWQSGINKDLLLPYRYLLLCERYGFPYGKSTNTVNEKALTSLLPKMKGFNFSYSLGPVLRCGSRNVTVAYMNRAMLNTLTREDADRLANKLLSVSKQSACEKARIYRATNVLLPLLSRLSTSCSVEKVVEIFDFALLSYKKSRFGNPEDLNIIYANLMPDGIQQVYETVFSSEIFCDMRENDVPLPQKGFNYYKPGGKEIETVLNGLESDNIKIRESAYGRVELLLKAYLDDDKKEAILNAVRKWRGKETVSVVTRLSYMDIPPNETEKSVWNKQIAEDLASFLGQDYIFDGSSKTISTLGSNLRNLTLEARYLKKAQISKILDKLSDVLETNFDAFSKDDSEDTLGGMRHFTADVFNTMGELVRLAYKQEYDDTKSSTKLFKVLEKYIPSHLPVRITMERLNLIGRVIGSNQMRDIISAQLFSDCWRDVTDSCNGLVAFAHYNSNYQKVLQNIIFYCNYAESDKMCLYLQTLSMIPLEKMTKQTQEMLAKMLEQVLERMPKQELTEEQKVDIMHDGVVLAASLKNAPADSPIASAVKEWEAYANDDAIYNDIRQPWFLPRPVKS